MRSAPAPIGRPALHDNVHLCHYVPWRRGLKTPPHDISTRCEDNSGQAHLQQNLFSKTKDRTIDGEAIPQQTFSRKVIQPKTQSVEGFEKACGENDRLEEKDGSPRCCVTFAPKITRQKAVDDRGRRNHRSRRGCRSSGCRDEPSALVGRQPGRDRAA